MNCHWPSSLLYHTWDSITLPMDSYFLMYSTIKWLEVLMVCIMNMFKSFIYNVIECACFKHMVSNCIWWVKTVCFKVCTRVQTPTSVTGYSCYINPNNCEQNNIQLCGDHIKMFFHITSLFLIKYMRGHMAFPATSTNSR